MCVRLAPYGCSSFPARFRTPDQGGTRVALPRDMKLTKKQREARKYCRRLGLQLLRELRTLPQFADGPDRVCAVEMIRAVLRATGHGAMAARFLPLAWYKR